MNCFLLHAYNKPIIYMHNVAQKYQQYLTNINNKINKEKYDKLCKMVNDRNISTLLQKDDLLTCDQEYVDILDELTKYMKAYNKGYMTEEVYELFKSLVQKLEIIYLHVGFYESIKEQYPQIHEKIYNINKKDEHGVRDSSLKQESLVLFNQYDEDSKYKAIYTTKMFIDSIDTLIPNLYDKQIIIVANKETYVQNYNKLNTIKNNLSAGNNNTSPVNELRELLENDDFVCFCSLITDNKNKNVNMLIEEDNYKLLDNLSSTYGEIITDKKHVEESTKRSQQIQSVLKKFSTYSEEISNRKSMYENEQKKITDTCQNDIKNILERTIEKNISNMPQEDLSSHNINNAGGQLSEDIHAKVCRHLYQLAEMIQEHLKSGKFQEEIANIDNSMSYLVTKYKYRDQYYDNTNKDQLMNMKDSDLENQILALIAGKTTEHSGKLKDKIYYTKTLLYLYDCYCKRMKKEENNTLVQVSQGVNEIYECYEKENYDQNMEMLKSIIDNYDQYSKICNNDEKMRDNIKISLKPYSNKMKTHKETAINLQKQYETFKDIKTHEKSQEQLLKIEQEILDLQKQYNHHTKSIAENIEKIHETLEKYEKKHETSIENLERNIVTCIGTIVQNKQQLQELLPDQIHNIKNIQDRDSVEDLRKDIHKKASGEIDQVIKEITNNFTQDIKNFMKSINDRFTITLVENFSTQNLDNIVKWNDIDVTHCLSVDQLLEFIDQLIKHRDDMLNQDIYKEILPKKLDIHITNLNKSIIGIIGYIVNRNIDSKTENTIKIDNITDAIYRKYKNATIKQIFEDCLVCRVDNDTQNKKDTNYFTLLGTNKLQDEDQSTMLSESQDKRLLDMKNIFSNLKLCEKEEDKQEYNDILELKVFLENIFNNNQIMKSNLQQAPITQEDEEEHLLQKNGQNPTEHQDLNPNNEQSPNPNTIQNQLTSIQTIKPKYYGGVNGSIRGSISVKNTTITCIIGGGIFVGVSQLLPQNVDEQEDNQDADNQLTHNNYPAHHQRSQQSVKSH